MSGVTPEFQVAFIRYIQRLMVEGDFVATYKFALLNALADISIEQPLDRDTRISIDQITEKFIELYWQHSLPFNGTDTSAFVFMQNTGKQAAIISSLFSIRSSGVQSLHILKQSSYWKSLVAKTKRTIKEGPLWRLQILSGDAETFLYQHNKQGTHIVLNDGVACCFRQYYELIISILRSHWLDKIRTIPANQSVIGSDGDLSDFLFGEKRSALKSVKPIFEEIQKGQCFYCHNNIKQSASEVDHFIPWAKYPSDLVHNFVLACHKCNNSKRDHLASKFHLVNWYAQNIQDNSQYLDRELGRYFYSNVARSEAIVDWSYTTARSNGSKFWERIGMYTV